MDWNRLDKIQSQGILEQVTNAADPGLFSKNSSEASFKPLSFYQDYMVYRITNYATLPSFSLDFLSDGESFYLLDGSPKAFEIVNARGSLYLSESNVIDYVEFYLANITADDGDIYMIRDVQSLPFIESLSFDQQADLENKHEQAQTVLDDETGDLIALVDLFYNGTLLKSGITVHPNGKIDIQPREMIMGSKIQTGVNAQ
jgi:hypothetical protein